MGAITHKIKKYLEAARLTNTEFASKVGVSRDTVYNWTDDNIKVSTLLKISDVLKVPVWQFFYTENPKDKYNQEHTANLELLNAYKRITELQDELAVCKEAGHFMEAKEKYGAKKKKN